MKKLLSCGRWVEKNALSSRDWDESATLRGATQFQVSPGPTPFVPSLRGRDRPVSGAAADAVFAGASPWGPLNREAEASLRPFSVGGCSGYSCAVVAGNDAMLLQRREKVKRIAG